jgi:hypothetical protein
MHDGAQRIDPFARLHGIGIRHRQHELLPDFVRLFTVWWQPPARHEFALAWTLSQESLRKPLPPRHERALWPADAIAWHPVVETQLAPDATFLSQGSSVNANAETTVIQGYPSGTPKFDTFDERVTMPRTTYIWRQKWNYRLNLHSASEVSESAQRAHIEKT